MTLISLTGIKYRRTFIRIRKILNMWQFMMIIFSISVIFFNFFTLYNLARDENIQGLCYYGVTKIPFEALDSVLEMLELILRIFEFAPDEINLTNNYVCVFAHNPDFIGNHKKGYCKRLKISKDKFCKKLKDVIKLFSKAKTEKRCIIHIGI